MPIDDDIAPAYHDEEIVDSPHNVAREIAETAREALEGEET